MASLMQEFTKGLWKELPPFRLVLGLCPTLAVTNTANNGLGMGAAVIFVLALSNVIISLVRNIIPKKVRIACFIAIAASLVVAVEMLMQAFAYPLYEQLGIFVPLIVVNCIILGRAEAFASKNGVLYSVADGIGMGVGFTLALAVIATLREFLGNGSVTLWGKVALENVHSHTMVLVILPAGGFITLGLILASINHLQAVAARKRGELPPQPLELDCRHCALCKIGE